MKRKTDMQLEEKHLSIEKKLGKQAFHYDASDCFEPLTKTVKDTNQKLLEESKATTKAFDYVFEKFSMDAPPK